MKLKQYIKTILKELDPSIIVVNFNIGVNADMTINDENKNRVKLMVIKK